MKHVGDIVLRFGKMLFQQLTLKIDNNLFSRDGSVEFDFALNESSSSVVHLRIICFVGNLLPKINCAM